MDTIKIEKVRNRLKDTIWELHQQYKLTGIRKDLDQILPYLAFNQDLNADQLEDLFQSYPSGVPTDFTTAVILRVHQTVRAYWRFRNEQISYRRVMQRVLGLEKIVRLGENGLILIDDPKAIDGFQLVKK